MVANRGATERDFALAKAMRPLHRRTTTRILVVLVEVIVLTGCGSSRQIDLSESDHAPAGLNDALAACRNANPDQLTEAVARASCVIRATEILRPLLPFPELLDQENALRKALAEQVQSGSISLLERNRQMTKFHARMLAEEQGRLEAKAAEAKSAAVKAAAAGSTEAEASDVKSVERKRAEAVPVPLAVRQWRVSNPDGCTSLGGNTANCY